MLACTPNAVQDQYRHRYRYWHRYRSVQDAVQTPNTVAGQRA